MNYRNMRKLTNDYAIQLNPLNTDLYNQKGKNTTTI